MDTALLMIDTWRDGSYVGSINGEKKGDGHCAASDVLTNLEKCFVDELVM